MHSEHTTSLVCNCCLSDISAHCVQRSQRALTYDPMSGAVDLGRLKCHMRSAGLSLGSKSDRSSGMTDLRDATAAWLTAVE